MQVGSPEPLPRLRRPLRRLRRLVRGVWFDWSLGVETTRKATTPNHVGDCHGYEPADVWQLRKLLPPHEVGADDVFVDVGAGKGRVLLFVARYYSCRQVIGVEISPELAAFARANVRALAADELARVSVVEADAASWAVPDDATVLHLFNPFQGETFRAFLAAAVKSQRQRPRLLRLLYTHGNRHDDVLAAGFEVVRTQPRFTLYQRRVDA